jgi:hypothetical protein
VNRIVQYLKGLLDRILPEHQGKRELIFVIALFVVIAGAGYLGGQFGWLHKDVPTSATPVATVVETPVPTETTSTGS